MGADLRSEFQMMPKGREFDLKFSGEKDNYVGGATRDKATGKGRYDLISPHMLRRLAVVYEKGAVNHGDRNWEKGIPFSRLVCSGIRHAMQYLVGMRDEDHLAQAIWNFTAVIHFQEMGRNDLDDIPSMLPAPEAVRSP